MKRNRIRKNNRGDSLVLVIGCIALLSIIGVILLAKTMDNRKMKLAEEQAQASFAGAESGSAEMVTVIENAAHDVIEDAFADMLVEYSLLGDTATRNTRYSTYFTQKLKNELDDGIAFQEKLKDALGVDADVKVSVNTDLIETVSTGETGYTNTIRIKDVVFSYSTAGSTTTITTDICVKTQIPDVEAGFTQGITCDFLDFAMISDGTVKHADTEDFEVTGNFYTGGDLLTTGSSAVTKIDNAKKFLVKNEMKVEGGSQVWVKATENSMSEGEGVWAGGISVDGSTFQSENVNLYIKDDLSVIGSAPTVVMKGNGTEYVGYSGNTSTTTNHEKSSAITINEIKLVDTDIPADGVPDKGLTLDLSGLGELFINGSSYICENNTDGTNNWGVTVDGIAGISAAEGILQGESIAYKEMQGMYLYPGSCLPQKHNPIVGSNVTIGSVSTEFKFKRPNSINWETLDLTNYVDDTNPYVTRTALLEGGSTVATYVYLNFKDADAAAQYVQDYLNTFLGDNVKAQINNLEDFSRILLPTETITLANAVSYDGTNVTMIPRATDLRKSLLDIAAALASQRSGGLFTSLRAEASINPNPAYKMVADGILNMDAINDLSGTEKAVSMTDPEASAKTYKFFAHDGNLTIDGSTEAQKYNYMNGILIVDGDLTISAPINITGLVLVTGEVKQTKGVKLVSDARAVEVLLTNDEVANFFQVYGNTSGSGFLSSEAVKISFENWERN